MSALTTRCAIGFNADKLPAGRRILKIGRDYYYDHKEEHRYENAGNLKTLSAERQSLLDDVPEKLRAAGGGFQGEPIKVSTFLGQIGIHQAFK